LKRLQTRVKIEVHREGGATFLTEEGIAKLREVMAAAQEVVQPVPAMPPVIVAPEIAARMDGLEKAVTLLVEKIAGQEKTIALQEEKIAALQSRAEIPVLLLSSPPRPVKPWQPVRVQPVPMSWYERLWLQMFSPETLREATL